MSQVEPPPLRPDQAPKRTLPAWVKVLSGFAIVLFLLFFAGVAAFYWYASGVHSELEETEAAVREAGYPVDASELDAYYPEIPDEENGALAYKEAHEELTAAPVDRADREALWEAVSGLQPGEGIPGELLSRMRDQAAASREALALLEKAATYPRVRFPVELSQLAHVEWSHVREFQEFGQVLCIAGLVAAEDGDWNRYVTLHGVRSHMISALDEEPILLSKFLRSTLLRMSMTELGLVFSQWTVPPETLSALAKTYAVSEGRAAAAETLAVERCAMVNMLASAMRGQMEGQDGPLSGITHPPQNSLSLSLVDQRTRLNIYRFSNRLVALGEKDWPAWIPESNAVEEALDEARYTAPLARLVMPSFNRATTAFVRTAATVRMIQTALALERYRAAEGSLPETLADLAPEYLDEAPGDPFDGETLRYRKEEAGYTIYSVYENLTDDGGAPMESRGREERSAGDWVFTVAR